MQLPINEHCIIVRWIAGDLNCDCNHKRMLHVRHFKRSLCDSEVINMTEYLSRGQRSYPKGRMINFEVSAPTSEIYTLKTSTPTVIYQW